MPVKQRQELVNCTNFQPCRKFLHKELGVTVIIDCRTTDSYKFRRKLGFNLYDVFNTKTQTVLESTKDAFEGKWMKTQNCVLDYKIGLYFHDYKLAIEVDEFDHCDRNGDKERKEVIEKELDCKFIRINPDEENFDVFKAIKKYTDTLKNHLKSL